MSPVGRLGRLLSTFTPMQGYYGFRKALFGETKKACDTADEKKDIEENATNSAKDQTPESQEDFEEMGRWF